MFYFTTWLIQKFPNLEPQTYANIDFVMNMLSITAIMVITGFITIVICELVYKFAIRKRIEEDE